MAVLGNSDFSRLLYAQKSQKKNVVLLWCVLGMYTCEQRWEVILLNHMCWGCFVITVSECVVVDVFVRKSVHHLPIAGARTMYQVRRLVRSLNY